MKSTFTILFIIKRTALKKDGTAPLLCRITVNGTSSAFSCRLFVEPGQWDAKSGQAIGNNATAKRLNSELKKIRKGVCKHYEQIFNGIGPLTAERVKISYLGLDRYSRTLLQVFKIHNEEYEQLVKNGVRRLSTYQKYCQVYDHLKSFLYHKYKLKDIALVDIRMSFITDFELFLRQKRKCTNNTVCVYITPLRKMIAIAQNNGWLDYNPFCGHKISFQRKERVYLTREELDVIMDMNFVKHKESNELIRDLFIFCAFTGISYIDLKNLTAENLKQSTKESWICFQRYKTGVTCNIPLLEIPLEILAKYQKKGKKKDALLPVPAYSTLLYGIKRIAKMCGIKKRISWHSSRHTFASEICMLNDVPIETISRMLGHTDVKTTQIYAKTSDVVIRRDMAKLSELLAAK
jgi:putative bacteriophage integrase